MYSTHEGYNDSIHGYYLEDLSVGMSASHAKTVTETDVVMFAGLTGASVPATTLGSVLMMSVGYAMCNAVTPALFAEMFDTRVRYTGVAVSGQLGQIFPGFAPAIAAAIIAAGGGGTQISLFVAACCAFSILVVLTARETRAVRTDELGGLRGRYVVTTEAPTAVTAEASR